MRVMEVENCPSFTTNMKLANMRMRDVQSKMVLSSRNTRSRVVKEFFFARFLEKSKLRYGDRERKNNFYFYRIL